MWMSTNRRLLRTGTDRECRPDNDLLCTGTDRECRAEGDLLRPRAIGAGCSDDNLLRANDNLLRTNDNLLRAKASLLPSPRSSVLRACVQAESFRMGSEKTYLLELAETSGDNILTLQGDRRRREPQGASRGFLEPILTGG